jgi:hypothetical protein
MKILRFVWVVAALLMIANLAGAAVFGENSWKLENPYMSLEAMPIGTATISSGYGTKSQIYISEHVIGTDTVDGVACVRVTSMRTENKEFLTAWLAQDVSGNVYLLKFYDADNPTPVVYGKSGAVLFIPANPQVGDKVYGDAHTVIQTGVTVPMLSTGLGPFTNCLKTTESDGDIVYYAPGIGYVKKDYSHEAGGFELKELIRGPGIAILENSLGITMQSLFYQGVKLDITLEMAYYFNPADPSGLYWKLTGLSNNQ